MLGICNGQCDGYLPVTWEERAYLASKIVLFVLSCIALIYAIVLYKQDEMLMGHCYVSGGCGGLLLVALLTLIEKIEKCRESALPLPEPLPERKDFSEDFKGRESVPVTVELSIIERPATWEVDTDKAPGYVELCTRLLNAVFSGDLLGVISRFVPHTSRGVLSRTNTTLYRAFYPKILQEFGNGFPLQECLNKDPFLKELFSEELRAKIPFIKLPPSNSKFRKSMGKIFKTYKSPYLITQSSPGKWLLFIQIFGTFSKKAKGLRTYGWDGSNWQVGDWWHKNHITTVTTMYGDLQEKEMLNFFRGSTYLVDPHSNFVLIRAQYR